MNQPTREEFERLEEGQKRLEEEQRQLREEFRQFKEQRTEEIKAVRVEVASEDVINRLKTLEEGQEELKEDTAVLKIQMQGARADILQIRESQADLRDRLIEHSENLKVIKNKQDAHSEILDKLVDFAESHEKNMATKDDVARIEKTQAEQGDLLRLMLDELRKSRGE